METINTQQASTAEGLVNAVGERAKSYVDAGVDAFNTGSEKVREIGHNANDYVRDNPWLAIGAAAGIGILIGFLLRGRRES